MIFTSLPFNGTLTLSLFYRTTLKYTKYT